MTFVGHALPASFFFGFGVYLLCLTLHRARTLSCGDTLSQFIPEKDTRILRNNGRLLFIATCLGMIYEEVAGILFSQPLRNILHLTLYLAFALVAVVLLLESCYHLPPDSHRIALALAFVIEYILWTEHASMKNGLKQETHKIMGQICAVSAITVIFSLGNPSNVMAYIAVWALMVFQGVWLLTLGLCDIGHCFKMDQVGSFFCLEALAVTLAIVLATASFGYHKGEQEQNYQGVGKEKKVDNGTNEKYQSLPLAEDC